MTDTRGRAAPSPAPPALPAATSAGREPEAGAQLPPSEDAPTSALAGSRAHRTPAGIPTRVSDPGTQGGAGSTGEHGGGASPRRRGARAAPRGGPAGTCWSQVSQPGPARSVCVCACSVRRVALWPGGFQSPALRFAERGGGGGWRVSPLLARVGTGAPVGRLAVEEGPSLGKSPERVPG